MKIKDLKLVHIGIGLIIIIFFAVLANELKTTKELRDRIQQSELHFQIMEGEYLDSIASNERGLQILEKEVNNTQRELLESQSYIEKVEIIIANLQTELHGLKQELKDTKTMLDVCSSQNQ